MNFLQKKPSTSKHSQRKEWQENTSKRKKRCDEKAEALKDSTDWKATADILVALQKEWKTIGPVAKKTFRCYLETFCYGM